MGIDATQVGDGGVRLDEAGSAAPARPPRPRVPPGRPAPVPGPSGRTARAEPWARAVPYVIALGAFTLYATYSLLKHRRMETHAYDLGLFEQVVRNYAHFRAPVSDIREPGFNVLGEHFHPILATLAPFYRLVPSPQTLLVAQALLIALSVVPVTRIGRRVFGPLGGAAFGAAYALSWGLQSAVAFEFHEVCFAVPMLAFGLERFLKAEYRAGVLWLLPLVLVKEDLALTLLAAGCWLALRRQWRWAAVAVGAGAVAFALVVFVVLPSVNAHGTYPFWSSLDGGPAHVGNTASDTTAGDVPLGRLVLDLPHNLLFPREKWMTLLTLLLPTGFLALRSPLLALVVPTLLWRFTSSNQYYWGIAFHYSAVLMPIVFAAFADAVVTLRASRRDWLRRYAAKAAIVPLAVSLTLCRDFPLIDLLHSESWKVSSDVRGAQRVLGAIPDGADVSSTERLAPRLTSRTRVTNFPTVLPGPGYVVADSWDGKGEWVRTWLEYLRGQGFRQVAEGSGVVVLRRD
ncbi:DUF2079 domain-containing protein [Yinghuangia seranimata]|uniref:DUF2079 domain-containing protein n=1 Tax=Yinghuangia seranimata TaxID=408067 RepID=UPI00248C1FEE|nr:DUF2079 domain-containing protein [Yinghuangia seranimata]MDI2129349.1 DUF2079 domain-containing protein [Yinghuangia seranimata]